MYRNGKNSVIKPFTTTTIKIFWIKKRKTECMYISTCMKSLISLRSIFSFAWKKFAVIYIQIQQLLSSVLDVSKSVEFKLRNLLCISVLVLVESFPSLNLMNIQTLFRPYKFKYDVEWMNERTRELWHKNNFWHGILFTESKRLFIILVHN